MNLWFRKQYQANEPLSCRETPEGVQILRANERFRTLTSWLESWHVFNFNDHYSPDMTHFGLLCVLNDDMVQPARGFGWHPHKDMEIVTWVLAGQLAHQDTTGKSGALFPGLAQRMSAGSGIQHTETNPSTQDPVHFVQMWVAPDQRGIEPSYEQHDYSEELSLGQWVAIASGRDLPGALTLRQKDATLWVARVPAGQSLELPKSAFGFLYMARGLARIKDVCLIGAGDSLKITSQATLSLTAEARGAEILFWEMHSELQNSHKK